MTREEEINKQAEKYGRTPYLLRSDNIEGTIGFKAGAKWADKTLIENACEWLRDNLYDTCDRLGNTGIDSMDYYSVSEFIEAFKKAMSGENSI